MSKLYLQNIIDDISFESLPAKWQGFSSNGGSLSGGDDMPKIPVRQSGSDDGNTKDLDCKLIKPLIWWEGN